ncbi:MAG: hypothetical protein AB4368_22105 [Xenococcaceae cyanobacterium]
MASRRYRTYKFLYDIDLGKTGIKRQRSYLDSNGIEITPITSLFLARVIDFNEKVTGSSQGLRYLEAHIGQSAFKANIPYAPGNPNLKAHLQEILAVENVDCGTYHGEKIIKNGYTTSFQ